MYKSKAVFYLIFLLLLCGTTGLIHAQSPYPTPQTGNLSFDSQGRPVKKNKDSLTLKHRDQYADSITINYKFFDSSRIHSLDTVLNDYTAYIPTPYTYNDLSNFGNAAYSLLFKPNMKAGFDAGFHAYDIYQYKLEDTRFFTTTRPYTQLGYIIGTKTEQTINILHTQNRKSNFNFTFEYRFINSPGLYRNQNTSHSNIRFNSFYQTTNKKYGAYLILILNSLKSSENGGLSNEKKLDSLTLGDPYEVPARIGNSNTTARNFFNTNITTGTLYKNSTIFFRHYYDIGKKDSLVTDSVTYHIFYPRLRLQHTVQLTKSQYTFQDYLPVPQNYSLYYNYYNPSDSVRFKDVWNDITNEFSILTFPDKKNQSQFLKTGVAYEFLKGNFDTSAKTQFSNIYLVGEYRNRTRNRKWDVEANGQLYVAGPYSGDYALYLSLSRELGRKVGALELGFQNVNRSPSYLFNNQTSFPVIIEQNLKKENTTRVFANLYLPALKLKLSGNYYIVNNFTYFQNFFKPQQETALFNTLQISAEKKFKLTRFFNWYSEVHFQQNTGKPPIDIPKILTRNRIVFEGNFFKNLYLSTGLEIRYYTPFTPYNYSPFNGQFIYQDSIKISNRPDINYFFHFRIKSFKGFIRLENLNTANVRNGSFGFNKYNFTAPHYAGRGLFIRYGFWWNFVN